LQALSYVQEYKILQTFQKLNNDYSFPSQLQVIYDYFFNTFINFETRIFDLNMWNILHCFSINVPKTNNAIEGWHNTFKNTFGTSIFI
jgi:hypothetical protein